VTPRRRSPFKRSPLTDFTDDHPINKHEVNTKRAPRLTLSLQFPAAQAYPSHKALLSRARVASWVKAALFADGELTLRFVDADEGRLLNRTYRGKDYATNVLTFAYAEHEDDQVASDIVVCCPVIEREAAEQGKTLEAHYAHMIVHGALHAQGYDHEADDEAREMEALETDILERLGYPDPYRER
jgi:probable rRNA maturation factor